MKSFLVIGLGKFGGHLARRLSELGNEVMVVDTQEEMVQELADVVDNAQVADCTKVEVLKSLGINNFDVCFVCMATNFQNSLEITSQLKELGAKMVVSKANTDIHAKFLLRNGADEVVYPEKDMAENMAVRYHFNHVYSYTPLGENAGIFEIGILDDWVGKSIRELDFRAKYNLNILAVKQGKNTNAMPTAETRFFGHEHILVLGYPKDISKLTKLMKTL